MEIVSSAEEVPLPADEVWPVIGDFSDIRKWATIVEDEHTEETPEGKVRVLSMPGGRVVRELLTAEDKYSYTYSLDRPDMKTYLSTVRVAPLNDTGSRIELEVQFEPADPNALNELTEGMSKFCRGNIRAMKRALGVST